MAYLNKFVWYNLLKDLGSAEMNCRVLDEAPAPTIWRIFGPIETNWFDMNYSVLY